MKTSMALALVTSLLWSLSEGQHFGDRHALEVGERVAQLDQRHQMDQRHANHYARLHYASDCSKIEIPNKVPLDPRVEILDVHAVQSCLGTGACILVDVRGEDRESGAIADAKHIPYTDIAEKANSLRESQLVVFHCQFSAHRAPSSANTYLQFARTGQRVAIMQGGFNEWKCMGATPYSDNARSRFNTNDNVVVMGAAQHSDNARSRFNINDNVVVWSKGGKVWHDDGRVVAVDMRKSAITVQYDKNRKQKELPLSSPLVHGFNGPYKALDKVFVWSNTHKMWFPDGQVVSTSHLTGKMVVQFDHNKVEKELPLWTMEVSKGFPKHVPKSEL